MDMDIGKLHRLVSLATDAGVLERRRLPALPRVFLLSQRAKACVPARISTIPHRGSVTNMAKLIANANTAPISRLPAHREVAAIKRTATTKLASASDMFLHRLRM